MPTLPPLKYLYLAIGGVLAVLALIVLFQNLGNTANYSILLHSPGNQGSSGAFFLFTLILGMLMGLCFTLYLHELLKEKDKEERELNSKF